MITITHGNDIAKSRNYYLEAKLKAINPIVVSQKSISYDYLFQTLEGGQLFSTSQDIFIENFFSQIKSNSTEFKKIIEYINGQKEIELFFWEEKELTKSQLAAFKKVNAVIFNYPQILFVFLDSIAPGNYKSIDLFNQLKETMEPDLIFYMIIRQFRFLLALLDNNMEKIDEVNRLAPWQMSKLKKQSNFFGKEKLIKNYKLLYEIDYKSKFGLLPYPLGSAIDIFLLDL